MRRLLLRSSRAPDLAKEDRSQADAHFSAVSPVQIVARGEVKIGHFDVTRFAKTVGPFDKVQLNMIREIGGRAIAGPYLGIDTGRRRTYVFPFHLGQAVGTGGTKPCGCRSQSLPGSKW